MNACVLLLFTIAKQFAYVWKFTKDDCVGTFFQLKYNASIRCKALCVFASDIKAFQQQKLLFFFFLNQELFLIYLFL